MFFTMEVGALAVLDHFFEVGLQQGLSVHRHLPGSYRSWTTGLKNNRSVHRLAPPKVLRNCWTKLRGFLIFVGDTGGELPERGQLLGLYQAILRGAKLVRAMRQPPWFVPAPRQTDGHSRWAITGLIGEGLDQIDLPGIERPRGWAREHHKAFDLTISGVSGTGENRPNPCKSSGRHVDFRVG